MPQLSTPALGLLVYQFGNQHVDILVGVACHISVISNVGYVAFPLDQSCHEFIKCTTFSIIQFLVFLYLSVVCFLFKFLLLFVFLLSLSLCLSLSLSLVLSS
jgi:hypothetical protein